MLLNELTKVDVGELLSYNETLPPSLWVDFTLKDDVKIALNRIANEFIGALGVKDDQIVDIILTGSCCNFNWTKFSDIDLHILLDYDTVCDSCESFNLDDCMKAKKSLWNSQHNISVYNFPVEVYVQNNPVEMIGNAGVYSLLNDRWSNKPERNVSVEYDEALIYSKAEPLMVEIDAIIDNLANDQRAIDDVQMKISQMRKAGLIKSGEFSIENLAFKVLRNSGYIASLYNYEAKLKDKDLSLENKQR